MNASGGMHCKLSRRELIVFKRSSIPPRTAGRWPRAQRWPEPLRQALEHVMLAGEFLCVYNFSFPRLVFVSGLDQKLPAAMAKVNKHKVPQATVKRAETIRPPGHWPRAQPRQPNVSCRPALARALRGVAWDPQGRGQVSGRPWPPSATTTVPVTNEADSWARKSTHAAISAGVPLRPIGPAAAAAASNVNCESVEM
jgi:hypothetical protein